MRRWWIVSGLALVVLLGVGATTVWWLNSSSGSFASNDAECTALLPDDLGTPADDDSASQAHQAITSDTHVDEELGILDQSGVDIVWSEVRMTADGVRVQGLCVGQDDNWQLRRVAVHAGDRVALAGTFEAAYAELSAS